MKTVIKVQTINSWIVFFWFIFTISHKKIAKKKIKEAKKVRKNFTLHSVEISEIYSHAFLAKISWK